MTTTELAEAGSEVPPARARRRAWAAPTAMFVAVFTAALLPFLGDRRFYLADDTTGAWIPVSRRIGWLLLEGRSHLMDAEMWRGGNFVASARYGVWNPVVLLLDVSVLQLDDLALAMLIVSATYLALLAGGVHLLARDYGAGPWPSAVAGVVVASGGWTLWLDAAWWTPHLASLAWTPFVWLTARRTARGRGSPLWFVLSAVMCITVGNPYSALVVAVIVVGVVLESTPRIDLGAVGWLFAAMCAVGLVALFVYLPFQQTSSVGFRETGIFNDESWAPGAGDLLTASSPTARPFVRFFGSDQVSFPAMYFAWFALPLAPWLRWRRIVRPERIALWVVAGATLVLVLGPSNFWLFRWPIRLLPYVYLPLALGLAVVLTDGLRRDRRPARVTASAVIVAGGWYLSWADSPSDLRWHVLAVVVMAVFLAAVIAVGTSTVIRDRIRSVSIALIGSTLVVLALQLQWQPVNRSLSSYQMPTTASAYEDNLGARYEGPVMQVASPTAIPAADRRPDGAYRDLTVGSTYSIAGLEAVTAYSAIGFTAHDSRLCIGFDGRVCADGFERLFDAQDDGRPLADLLALGTIVVQRSLVETESRPAPDGWSIAEITDHVVVWKRTGATSWPDSRLSSATGPIDVVTEPSEPHRDVVSVERTGPGTAQLTFARLAWPGHEASLDGRALPVGGGPAGLLTVAIPDDVDAGRVVVTWTPPYWRPSLAVLVLGALVAIGLAGVWWWRPSWRPGPGD